MVDAAMPTLVDVLFEATDSTQLRSVIGVQDSVLAGSDASKDVWNGIVVTRDAKAYLGDGTGKVVVAPGRGVEAPLVQVGALARDRATGGVLSDFAGSKQAGTSTALIRSAVEASIAGAELDVAGLSALALEAGTLTTTARQARNQGITSTAVRIDTATIRSKGDANLIAQDRSSWKATGGGYTGELLESWYGVASLPASLAGNDVESSVSVTVAKSSISAAGVRSLALAAQSLQSEVKVGKMGPLKPGPLLGLTLGFDINIGTLRAWNTLNGGTGVSVDQTSITSSASIELAARDQSKLKADTPTGANASPDGDQEVVMAVNLAGRYFGDLGTFDAKKFAGGEPSDTGKARDTAVTVNASKLDARGAVAVDARASLVMEAIADVLSEPGVRTAAAGLLAINRYRGGARAEVEARTGVASIKAGGTVSVIARDALKASAKVDAGRPSAGGLQVGGILVLNDLKRDLSARLDSLGMDAGALTVEAIDSATVTASARGRVDAYASDPFDDWTQLAANGSVTTNWLLGGAKVAANDVSMRVAGDVAMRADAAATLSASNEVSTVTMGGAGAALAYNLIGRQGAGGLKATTVSGFLDGAMGALATYEVGASFDKGFVEAGGNFAIEGNLALKASATLAQATDGLLGSSSAAMVQNLSEASTNVRFLPTAGTEHYVGGHVRIAASDVAGLTATASMSAEGLFTSAGLAVARNQANHVVDARVTGAELTAGGDIDVWADSKALINATLTGKVGFGGRAATGLGLGGLSLNALMATNLINGAVTAIVSGGRLAAAGDLDVHAANDADIRALNKATTQGTAAASLALAFNAIGWKDQSLSDLRMAALLGTGMGSEATVFSKAAVHDANLSIAGDASVDASSAGAIDARLGSASDGGFTGSAGFALALNRVSSGSHAWIGTSAQPGVVTGRSKVLDIAAGGDLEVNAADDTEINASVSLASAGGMLAVGGTAVRNDARGRTIASIDDAKVATGGLLAVTADESATISAALDGTAKTDQGLPLVGGGLAVNGLIATNLVLAESSATVSDSDLSAAGDLVVDATNTASISADNTAALRSGGIAVGVLLAYNTIGWKAEDLISQTIDTIIGEVGTAQPATVTALVTQSTLDIGGDAAITADVTATVTANISNEVSARSGGASASLVLATNQVKSSPVLCCRPRRRNPS